MQALGQEPVVAAAAATKGAAVPVVVVTTEDGEPPAMRRRSPTRAKHARCAWGMLTTELAACWRSRHQMVRDTRSEGLIVLECVRCAPWGGERRGTRRALFVISGTQ